MEQGLLLTNQSLGALDRLAGRWERTFRLFDLRGWCQIHSLQSAAIAAPAVSG
jgi:hypothetical protein